MCNVHICKQANRLFHLRRQSARSSVLGNATRPRRFRLVTRETGCDACERPESVAGEELASRSLGVYMGGSKPSRPTSTRIATFFPPRTCPVTTTLAPGTSSDLSAAFTVTMGMPFGTWIVFSPSL